jgi:transposase
MNPRKLSAAQEACMRAELNGGKSRNVYRRAAALLALNQGWPVRSIAQLLGVARQSIYNWIATYKTGEDPVDLRDAPRSGRPALWTEDLDAVLTEALNRSPRSYGYSVDQWTAKLLQHHLVTSRQKDFSAETVRRRLRQMGYLWKNGRYLRATDYRNSFVEAPFGATSGGIMQDAFQPGCSASPASGTTFAARPS